MIWPFSTINKLRENLKTLAVQYEVLQFENYELRQEISALNDKLRRLIALPAPAPTPSRSWMSARPSPPAPVRPVKPSQEPPTSTAYVSAPEPWFPAPSLAPTYEPPPPPPAPAPAFSSGGGGDFGGGGASSSWDSGSSSSDSSSSSSCSSD